METGNLARDQQETFSHKGRDRVVEDTPKINLGLLMCAHSHAHRCSHTRALCTYTTTLEVLLTGFTLSQWWWLSVVTCPIRTANSDRAMLLMLLSMHQMCLESNPRQAHGMSPYIKGSWYSRQTDRYAL